MKVFAFVALCLFLKTGDGRNTTSPDVLNTCINAKYHKFTPEPDPNLTGEVTIFRNILFLFSFTLSI